MSLDAFAKKRVLIVDPLETFRFSIKQTLMSLGMKLVDSVSNAQAVLSGFQSIHYDVVLCNYDLGKGKNGQELLEELRLKKLLKHSDLFFIISAEVSRDKVMGALENAPDGYLVKPITPKSLELRLGKALELKDALSAVNIALDKGNLEKALTECEALLSEGDKHQLACLESKAWLLTRLNRLDEAIELYQSHDHLWAQYGLAKAHIRNQALAEAEQLLKKIISNDPDQVEAMDLLAEIYRQQGLLEQAQTLIEQAVSCSPHSLMRQRALAEVCVETKDDVKASEAFQNVLALGEQSVFAHPDQYYDYAQFLANLAKHDSKPEQNEHLQQAFQLLEQANKRFVTIDEIEIQSKLVSASLNAAIGNTVEAEAILQQFMTDLSQHIQRPETLIVAARTMQELGHSDAAEQMLEQAADLAEHGSEQLGLIYDQLNQAISPEARQKAFSQNKKGLQLYHQGEVEQAAKELRLAILLTPRHIPLNLNLIQVLVECYAHESAAQKQAALLEEVKKYLHRVRHIPEKHREYPRFQHLSKRYQQLVMKEAR